MRSQSKKTLLKVCIFMLCGLVLFIAGLGLYIGLNERAPEVLVVEETILPEPEPIPEPEPAPEPEPELEPEPEPVEIPIDFEELWAINPHVHGWITVPGTEVDYPILQSPPEECQEFYLSHTIERAFCGVGSVFTQDYNSLDFTDRNTVIYAHNMGFGDLRMFGSLYYIVDDEGELVTETFTIYTPESILIYQIFAVVVYDDLHIMIEFDFEEMDDFHGFLNKIQGMPDLRFWDDEIVFSQEDRIVTLATCTDRGFSAERFLVVGVLIEEKRATS